MSLSAEQRSKFAALHRQWWRPNKWKYLLEWDEKLKIEQSKQTKELIML